MKLKAKQGVAGLGLGGVEYVNDAAGCIDVPTDFVDIALANGYEPVSHLAVPTLTDEVKAE